MHDLLIVDVVAFAAACTVRPSLILDPLDVGAVGIGCTFPLLEDATIHFGESLVLLLR